MCGAARERCLDNVPFSLAAQREKKRERKKKQKKGIACVI
jgi:hypothetical protein